MTFSSPAAALRCCALFGTLLSALPAFAVENETTPMLALRLSKALPQNSYVDISASARSREAFVGHEREIFELRYGRRVGNNEFTVAYNQQFDRNGSPGSEHRLWQQFRHRFTLENSSFESSVRLEERYFETNDLHGARLRVLNRWNKPLSANDVLRLGYEWVFNLNDINRTTQRGVAQDRLIAALQHTLRNGNRLEFEYQMRYLHIPAQDNRLQHQLQLRYVIAL